MENILISAKNASVTNNGIFEGWGTSLCWWANRVGHSEKLVKDSARLFFSEEGLGLNIMRYNIGGGDDPSHNHIVRTDSEMPGWWKYDEDKKDFVFSPDKDKSQLNVLREAYKAAGENAYVEAFSNSPPYYMTVSGCTSGHTKKFRNNLKKSCIAAFSEYLAEVCGYIENEYKIKIKSLAPMNEPFSLYWNAYSEKQEGCYVSPGRMQSRIILAAKNSLKKRKLNDITVTASDETNTDTQNVSMMLLSRKASDTVGRISTHTYKKATPAVGIRARKKGKNIWMDESDWSSISGEDSGEMGPGLWLAQKIIEDINTLSVSAWVIWQIMAGYISKVPDSKGRRDPEKLPELSKGFWGTAFPDIDTEEIYLTQKYYAFGQFTRYIRPGMTVIHTNSPDTLAAFDKNSKKLVIVCVNAKDKKNTVSLNLDGFDCINKNTTAFRTSGSIKDGEHWNEIPCPPVNNNILEVTLKENSITTFVI